MRENRLSAIMLWYIVYNIWNKVSVREVLGEKSDQEGICRIIGEKKM